MSWVHAVITRMGIGVYDEGWFDFRLDLFESITVPSMAAQTSQDFHWLIVVGERMPPASRQRLERAVAGMGNVVILPVEFKTDLKDTVASWVKREARSREVDHAITSRIDDDDALRVDAFERLHHEADAFLVDSSHHYAVMSFTTGSMWLPTARRGYTRYHDSLGIGLSVIEPAKACRSVYDWPHRDVKHMLAPRGARILGISEERLWWLYTTHTLADTDRGDQARVKKIMEHRFGYHLDDDLLRGFGLDPAVIDRFAHIEDPAPLKPIRHQWPRAMDLERELKDLRAKLPSSNRRASRRIRAQIEEIERELREIGSGILTSG